MDKILAELLSTAGKPLIEALDRHTAALTRQSDLTERVIAGQEAAMAKLEGGSTGARKPRETAAEKKAREAAEAAAATTGGADTAPSTSTPAAGEKPVTTTPAAEPDPVHPLLASPNGEQVPVKNPKTGEMEDTPTANYRASDFSRDQVKNEFIGWLGDTTDADERKARAAFVAAIGQHFGVAKPFHPTEGLTDDDQRKQTLFFLRRKREGLAVDFSTDYDFDGDPLADQTVDAAEDEVEDALG
ncbi:hypothetical protein [Sphingomonas hankookensis]|uniref:hypothetical protein n=1 Tax=Sphingomonas hankookensis TaxID=563996 RepID=UPI003F78DFDE